MGKYDDIIDMPHYKSEKHPHMSVHNRAAQFSPFAALSGYDSAIKETARQTIQKTELTEDERIVLDEKFKEVMQTEHRCALITYFKADKLKDGGSYKTVLGVIKKIDEYNRRIILQDKSIIAIDDIYDINVKEDESCE